MRWSALQVYGGAARTRCVRNGVPPLGPHVSRGCDQPTAPPVLAAGRLTKPAFSNVWSTQCATMAANCGAVPAAPSVSAIAARSTRRKPVSSVHAARSGRHWSSREFSHVSSTGKRAASAGLGSIIRF